jgi:hypothetical protein
MWIVAKIKRKEIETFKKDLIKKSNSNVKFYCPKIEYQQYYKKKIKRQEKLALEDYIFCYNENFNKTSYVNKLKFVKGLEYFLNGYLQNQNEIVKFVKYCKWSENNRGYLTQAFFKTITTKKAKFISGPFANMMFEIIKKQKNKLKIIVGNVVTTVSDNSNYLYRPV